MSIQDKLTTIAENVPKVYESGIAEGKAQGDIDWWNIITDNFTRRAYDYGFANMAIKDFAPPQPIVITGRSLYLLHSCPELETIAPNSIDFSGTPDIQTVSTSAYYYTFADNPKLKAIPTLNMPARGMYYTFGRCTSLERIELVQVRENTQMDSPFFRLPMLKYIRFSGKIGVNIGFSYSPMLSKDSINSVISCLSTTSSGKTATFSLTAVNNAFETSEGAADGSTSAEWNALIATRSNWTINLLDSN